MTTYAHKSSNWLALIVLLVLNVSCASNSGNRSLSKNVHVYNSVDMSNRMKGMSAELLTITTLTSQSTLTPSEHNELLKRLQSLSLKARTIGGEGVVTNYSVINQYMGAFIYDVELAKQFANMDTPNYVPANRLVKSCISCHDT